MRGEGIKDVAQHFLYVGFLGQGGQLVVGCVQEGGLLSGEWASEATK